MGYCIEQEDSKFLIKKENIKDCLNKIKSLAKRKDMMSGGHYTKNGKKDRWFSWVEMSELKQAKTIVDAFSAWRWAANIGDNGDVIELFFDGDKLGDDEFLFRSIAEFVEDGSFIELCGEDKERWRWYFKNGKMTTQYPDVRWSGSENDEEDE